MARSVSLCLAVCRASVAQLNLIYNSVKVTIFTGAKARNKAKANELVKGRTR